MKKLQQFYIMKFSSKRLEKFGYHLKRILGDSGTNIRDIRSNRELIALGDNQALRTIRSIRYERNPDIIQYDPNVLEELYMQKKQLKKLVFTKSVKKEISIINNKIDEMLFMPEYVSVVIDDISHYKKIIKDGLYINGFKYVRLMCSAGQARVNTVILIREDYEEELKKRLKCGAKNVKITKNKYNAYFALSSSSTYLIPKPNVYLINDCEIEMEKKVDWISKIPKEEKTKLSNNERVTEEFKTLTFNLFDGCGAVSVEFAKRVAEELDLDYIPAAFCIRCAYIKGMVFVIDFKQYAREHNIEYVIDMYGNQRKIEDMDMILTKSQFKLYNAYDSMDDYDRLCEENGILWGITKVTPKVDDYYFRSNYQFCQSIDLMNDNDVAELCDPTVNWLKSIAKEDVNYSLLYLLGNVCDKQDIDYTDILNLTSDNICKALILNHQMIEDEYVKQTIVQSINKKIRESYLGKLILDGNFSVMIPDMYAFMQHAFGHEVTGALEEFEHYSHFWNERNKKEVVAMRSPLTWRSEVNKLTLIQNELTEKWFKYLTSGIVYNVWGCDCIIHADSDFDGDIVATTDNPVFLRCRYDNLPITYNKSTVDKEYINEDELYLADIQSFNSTIGQITNISTSFYELLAKYEGKPEYAAEQKEILDRLKLIRKAQGDSIDKAKGIKIEPMPTHWTKRVSKTPKNETIEHVKFCNSIVADRKPYFFRYLYSSENAKYKDYIERANSFSITRFDKTIQDLLDSDPKFLSDSERDYLENEFKKYIPLIDYNGRMNRICHYMEMNISEVKSKSNTHTPQKVLDLMYFDSNRTFLERHVNIMNNYYLLYKEDRKKINMKNTGIPELVYYKEDYNEEPVIPNNFTQYCSNLRKKIWDEFKKDMDSDNDINKYITDLALYICYELYPSRVKTFVWDLFGNQIVDNLKMKCKSPVTIPVRDEDNGTIFYLGKKYKLLEVEVK